MSVHVFTAPLQSAHNYVDRCGDRPLRVKLSPHKMATCERCKRLRKLKSLYVQVYYDGLYFWCKDIKGCKK